jgi:sulfoxide reductase heme-binding subunit YedZ
MTTVRPRLPSYFVLLLCVAPVVWYSGVVVIRGVPRDPIAALTSWSGTASLLLLVASLAITPLVRWAGLKAIAAWRRPLGVSAGVYALAHTLVYLGLDYGWSWSFIWLNISSKRHLIVGTLSMVLLIPLLFTSTRGWQQRLGVRWKKLHFLVYPAAIAAGLHFLWLVKTDVRWPLVATGVVTLLLLLRLPQRKREQGKEFRK